MSDFEGRIHFEIVFSLSEPSTGGDSEAGIYTAFHFVALYERSEDGEVDVMKESHVGNDTSCGLDWIGLDTLGTYYYTLRHALASIYLPTSLSFSVYLSSL
jgi:hypothetical protein